jgi:Ser/Thr protein kinase RdoA (MazF antagonist)
MAKIYFLHRAGEIHHRLLMGWGGESPATMELNSWLRQAIRRSNKETKAMEMIHEDLRRDNILWNEEV